MNELNKYRKHYLNCDLHKEKIAFTTDIDNTSTDDILCGSMNVTSANPNLKYRYHEARKKKKKSDVPNAIV